MLPAIAALLLAVPAAEEAVRAADVALDRAAGARDAVAFGALLEDDAIFAARRVSRGRAAVVEAWTPFLTAGGPRLRWAPARAFVASSGDLAVTTGKWVLETEGKDGKPGRAEGEYVTVWRRAREGQWRVLLDASLEPAAKLGEGLARTPVRSVASEAGDLEATLGTWTRGDDEGAYLVVRRRARGGASKAVVDSAFTFPRPERPPRSG